MLVPGITALIYREKSGIAFLITILACLAIGVPLVSRKPSKNAFYSREAVSYTHLMEAPISPSGPPYWLEMNWASFALGVLIFTGYWSLFS